MGSSEERAARVQLDAAMDRAVRAVNDVRAAWRRWEQVQRREDQADSRRPSTAARRR